MSKTSVKVEVTQVDIDEGCRKISGSCPVALALARASKAKFVNVYARCNLNTGHYRWIAEGIFRIHFIVALPDVVGAFVGAFDEGKPVSPFEFTLEMPVGAVAA